MKHLFRVHCLPVHSLSGGIVPQLEKLVLKPGLQQTKTTTNQVACYLSLINIKQALIFTNSSTRRAKLMTQAGKPQPGSPIAEPEGLPRDWAEDYFITSGNWARGKGQTRRRCRRRRSSRGNPSSSRPPVPPVPSPKIRLVLSLRKKLGQKRLPSSVLIFQPGIRNRGRLQVQLWTLFSPNFVIF